MHTEELHSHPLPMKPHSPKREKSPEMQAGANITTQVAQHHMQTACCSAGTLVTDSSNAMHVVDDIVETFHRQHHHHHHHHHHHQYMGASQPMFRYILHLKNSVGKRRKHPPPPHLRGHHHCIAESLTSPWLPCHYRPAHQSS